MYKKGDKIRLIDDNLKGVVKKVVGSQILIEDEFGFEQTFHASELILDQTLEIDKVEIKKETSPKIPKQKTRKTDLIEVDLHIGQLVDFPQNLTNYEMLQIQLRKVEETIEEAKVQQISRIVFIHGHGSGKLKQELDLLLQSYTKLEFYDASFQKYKLGATEVRLFSFI